ncbi:MAG: rod shape-determining protein RodA [Ignavibacteriales bacterium]|nr:rod shape-determining protein RodA [Ignavibacteriales bacterium]
MLEYLKEYFDYRALLICLGLVAVGLLSVYSATYDVGAAAAFDKQLVWAGIGFAALVVAAIFPLKTLQRISLPLYIGTLGVLLVILVIGHTVAGSKSWLGVAKGFGGQPSEFAKVTTVLALAAFLARTAISLSNPRHLILAGGIVALPMMLILAEPDLGTSVVFFLMLLPVLYWAGASNFVLAAILAPIIAAAGALFGTLVLLVSLMISGALLYAARQNRFAVAVAFALTLAVGLSVQAVYERLPAYQQKRISTFLNPGSEQKGAGYNVYQSKVAIGSGGFFGKGYLQGTQTQLNFIPEQWTDFIFCVPGEEFGFVGASIVIGLFTGLLLHGVKVGGMSKNKFASAASIGITGVFGVHVLINVGMSMGLLPVIGIPLPFLSYGGSALVANMAMVGLLMNFYSNRKEH